MSNRAIAKLFNMGVMTVSDVVARVYGNADSAKSYTPQSSTSTVPMASTEDRTGTREDARS